MVSGTTRFFSASSLIYLGTTAAVANEVKVVYGVRIILAEEEGDKVQIDGYSSQSRREKMKVIEW